MTAVYIVLGIVAALIIFMLVTPITLYVDTATSSYFVRWTGIGKVSIVPDKDKLVILRYRIFFF